MSDTKIRYNEFDKDTRTLRELGIEPGTPVVDLTQWPADAKPDDKLYRLAWTQNQSARTTTIGGDVLLADDEGGIQFVNVDPDPEMADLPDSLSNAIEGKVGSYGSMSKLAVHLNKLQEGAGYLYRSFNFFPDPIEEMNAA